MPVKRLTKKKYIDTLVLFWYKCNDSEQIQWAHCEGMITKSLIKMDLQYKNLSDRSILCSFSAISWRFTVNAHSAWRHM